MNKGINLISEIGKYFKENDATSAMNKIMEITRTLSFSEKRLFGEQSRCNCKYSQIACTAIPPYSTTYLPRQDDSLPMRLYNHNAKAFKFIDNQIFYTKV